MSNKKTIFQYISLTLLVIYLLTTTPVITANGEAVIGYGGYVSSDEIESGSEVTFFGSIKNNWTGEITVNAFHVKIVDASNEDDIQKSIYNITYSEDRSSVSLNSSYTAYEKITVKDTAGTYNVSIYFTVTYGTNNTEAYSLINQTLEITQTYEAPKVAFYLVITLLLALVGLMAYSLLNRFRR
ncbi:MAG: hypothetical protein ACTSYA_06300 [Candidatus Kariarchaeaceae archaeon]